MLRFAFVSLVLANTGSGHWFQTLLEFPFGIQIGSWRTIWPFEKIVNEGLMSLFFLVVGLEIKREVLEGHLSKRSQAVLPVMAALGGMVVPACIYLILGHSHETYRGWAIPMATDIAFSLSILSLLGKRVPIGLKVFLTALAIADDLGAVLVIALFYTQDLDFVYLALMLLCFVGLLLANRFNVRFGWIFFLGGILLWYFTYKSGIHATIAGVLFALCLPFRSDLTITELTNLLMDRRQDLEKDLSEGKIDSAELRRRLNHFSHNLQSLSHRMVADLHIIVTFLVMPLFAFCNTAIRLDYETVPQLINPVGMGIFIGLFIGKPLGVLSFSWITIWLGWANRPARTPWTMMVGASLLAGIGFTMSFFLSVLAFPDNLAFQNNAKMAILFASLLAACTGFFWLKRATGKPKLALKVN